MEDFVMNVVEIIFSPTGGTEKVAHIIGKCWSENPKIIDLSDAKADFAGCEITGQEMVVIAMPSFGGRAPAVAIERLRKMRGNNARCVLVCVYGSRAYEDTLAEMEDAAKESGFEVIAALSAVAEHSIIPQYATGPYKKAGGGGLVPKPDKSCVKCGVCAKACPVQAIDSERFMADAKKCISCMRCMKVCPQNARKVNGLMVSAAALAIKKACVIRKENELFL